MKKGERESYKRHILDEEMREGVGQKYMGKLRELSGDVKNEKVSVGGILKKISKIKGKNLHGK